MYHLNDCCDEEVLMVQQHINIDIEPPRRRLLQLSLHHHQSHIDTCNCKYSNQHTAATTTTTTIIHRKRKRTSGFFHQPTATATTTTSTANAATLVVNNPTYLYLYIIILSVYLINQYCKMSSSWLVLHRIQAFQIPSLQRKVQLQRLSRTTSISPIILQQPRIDIDAKHRYIGHTQLRYSTMLNAKRKSTITTTGDDHIASKAKASSKRQSSSSPSPSSIISSETSKRSLSTSSAAMILEEENTEELVLISTTTVMKARKKKSSITTTLNTTTTTIPTPSVSAGTNGTAAAVTIPKTKKATTKVKPKASTPSNVQVVTVNQTVAKNATIMNGLTSHSQTVPTTNTTTVITNQSPIIMDTNYSYVPDNGMIMFPSIKSFTLPHIQQHNHSDNVNNSSTINNINIDIDTKIGPEFIVISRTPIATTSANDTAVTSIDDDPSVTDVTQTTSTSIPSNDDNSITKLLNPYDLILPNATTGEWKIPYPKALSPSSIKEFQACPQSFLFQYILGLKQPTTTILAKGTMCHSALERIFDIEPNDRSLSVLQNLFRTVWSEQRMTDMYRTLFEEDVLIDYYNENNDTNDVAANSSSSDIPHVQPMIERRRYIQKEITWGQEGLGLLRNYWLAEDASSILRPNPVQREVWVKSNLQLLSDDDIVDGTRKISIPKPLTITTNQTIESLDVNSIEVPTNISGSMFLDYNSTNTTNLTTGTTSDSNDTISKFLVRGIVDRLDMVQDPKNKSQISLRLIDYKTGKAPDLKYSPSMNTKIQNEAFDQLLIYALLLRESNRHKINPMPLRYLRLFYLTSIHEDGKAIYWDMDLGETQEERDMILHTVHVSLSNVYRNICQLIDTQNFLAFHGCQRSFCYCHKCRPKFIPGTVWEPPTSSSS